MLPIFSYFSLSLFLGGFVAIISGLIVYLNDKKKNENKMWLLLNLITAIWSFGYFSMLITTQKEVAIFSNLILHGAAIFIPLFYFLFILTLTHEYKNIKHRIIFFIGVGLSVVFSLINPTTLFIQDVSPKFVFNYAPDAGSVYIYFTLYFFILVLYSLILLFNKIKIASREDSIRLKYVLFSSIAGFLGGGSVFFLTFNINIPPYPIILFSFYPMIIAYAIIKHSLFDVKVVAAELLTFGIWVFVLIKTLLAETSLAQILSAGLLIVIIIFGVLLIRGVRKEIEMRERAKKLVGEIAMANKELRRMEKQKTEFVSIASHQLRTPLTAIKGYASMLLEGSFGKISSGVREAVDKIYKSNQVLVVIIDDFLMVSRIEQGRMQYDFNTVYLRDIIKEVLKDVKSDIEEKGLTIQMNIEDGGSFIVRADYAKMKQVVHNVVNNAIRYTEKGFIKILLLKNKKSKKLRIAISDTGMGIKKKMIPKLFKKFSKGKESKLGSGIGLYVAKEIVNAHKGRIWAQSDGGGYGTTFFIELPEAKKVN